ncbi:MAG: pyridoxamine 5'-phosphate oxidase family protein [Bacteroidales bacterium]|nr:pyridoxamine 5'-phosphate oxidase family protein [Bacteroidales bacterium]
MKLEHRVVEFIKEHHVLTLSTAVNNIPYSCNCFYTYFEEDNVIICTSDYNTKHIKDAQQNNNVSGSIVLETSIVGKIQGIQFNGIMIEATDILFKKYKKAYLKRFPFAILKNTALWIIDLTFIKMTDNRLGFGKKIIWEKNFNDAI